MLHVKKKCNKWPHGEVKSLGHGYTTNRTDHVQVRTSHSEVKWKSEYFVSSKNIIAPLNEMTYKSLNLFRQIILLFI